jgi:hypothetical protein
VIENRIITIAGRSSRQISFMTSQNNPGTYDIELGGLAGTFSVMEPAIYDRTARFSVKIPPVFTILLGIFSIALIALLIIRKRIESQNKVG